MSRFGIAVVASDATGIVATVIGAIRGRQFAIGEVWAETRCGSFLLSVDLGESSPQAHERAESVRAELEERGYRVVIADHDDRGEDARTRADFAADIAIEGDRRVDILQKTVNAIATERASVESVRSEYVDGQLRYVVKAKYEHRRSASVMHALEMLSAENDVEFIANPRAV